MQLALVGSMATDDPEGWEFFNSTMAYARRRPGHPHPQQPEQRRRDRGERLPVAGRRGDPEVHARGLRADRVRGALEGAPVHRRRRGRHPAPGAGRRDRLPRVDRPRSAPTASLRDPPRARSSGKRLGRAGKEHVRTHFLTPRLLRDWLQIFRDLQMNQDTPARPGLQPRPGHVRAGRAARSRERGGGGLVTALTGLVHHRDALWVASAMTDEDVEVAQRARRRRRSTSRWTARRYRIRLVESRPGGLRPLLQRGREPDAVVHPALPVGPLERAGHPPARGARRTSTATAR